MKKLLAILLAMAMLVSFAGCGSKESAPANNNGSSQTEENGGEKGVPEAENEEFTLCAEDWTGLVPIFTIDTVIPGFELESCDREENRFITYTFNLNDNAIRGNLEFEPEFLDVSGVGYKEDMVRNAKWIESYGNVIALQGEFTLSDFMVMSYIIYGKDGEAPDYVDITIYDTLNDRSYGGFNRMYTDWGTEASTEVFLNLLENVANAIHPIMYITD